MKNVFKLLAMLFCMASFVANAATINVTSSQTLSAIQSAVSGANVGDTVAFAAGTYPAGSINLTCGVSYTGPVVAHFATPTAIVGNSATGFAFKGNCNIATTTSVKNFRTTSGALLYLAIANQQNWDVENNMSNNLQGNVGGSAQYSTAIFVDGSVSTTLTGLTIKYNTFGDANSCSAIFANSGSDDGGYCAGIFVQSGISINHTITNNFFYHVEEGLHYHQHCSGCQKGQSTSVTSNLDIENNYLLNWHRIAIEIQTDVKTGGTPMKIAHNAFIDPINAYFGTMSLSEACCTGGGIYANSSPPNAANETWDNLLIQSPGHFGQAGSFWAPVIGIEYWGGAGSWADYNYIEGGGSNGINWGYNNSPFYIRYNYLCQTHAGSYITDEEHSNAPTLVSNVTGTTCSTTATTTPTLSQSSTQVTITNNGTSFVNSYPSQQTISSYYTTDGSTPTTSSTLYTGPFTPATGAVVKVISMWGQAPLPTSYPSGYGWVPSSVASLTFTGGGGTVTLSSIAITPTASIVAGTVTPTQLTATGTYSNATTQNLTSSVTWATTTPSVCTISAGGALTTSTAGTCTVTATSGSVVGTQPITVTAASITAQYLGTIPTANVNMLSVGQTVQMQLTVYYSNGTNMIGTISSAAVINSTTGCTISSSGLVTATAASTKCTVQANGSSSAWDFSITTGHTLTNIILQTSGSPSVNIGSVIAVSATGVYTDGNTGITPTSWLASNNNCTVDSSGNVTGVASGTCTITATFSSITSNPGITITVMAPTPTLVGLSLPTTFSLVDQNFQLVVNGVFSDGSSSPIDPSTVNWTSSNTNVIVVNAAGIAQIVGIGSSQIFATSSTVGVSGSNSITILAPARFPFIQNVTPTVPYSWSQQCPLTQTLQWNNTYILSIGNDGSETITQQ